MSRIIHASELAGRINQALGLEHTRRIVIDIQLDLVVVYVEMYGTTKLLDIDWTALSGAEIRIVDSEGGNDE